MRWNSSPSAFAALLLEERLQLSSANRKSYMTCEKWGDGRGEAKHERVNDVRAGDLARRARMLSLRRENDVLVGRNSRQSEQSSHSRRETEHESSQFSAEAGVKICEGRPGRYETYRKISISTPSCRLPHSRFPLFRRISSLRVVHREATPTLDPTRPELDPEPILALPQSLRLAVSRETSW